MVFKEINPEVWTYDKDGDSIEGILVKVETEIGANKSNMYTLETEPGKFLGIWGSTILDQRMSLVSVGDKVRITFKGLGEKKAGKNQVKIFKVEVDQPEEEVEEESELPSTK